MTILPSSFLVFALGLLLQTQATRAFADVPSAEEADGFYQNGDCPKALRAYAQIQANSQSPTDLKELGLFRTAYCYLQTERPANAAASFSAFLKLHPDNDEARLRFAQASLQRGDPALALENALRVKDPDFAEEATLQAAQAELELGQLDEALSRLTRAKVSSDWKPAYIYWTGVARYRKFDFQAARSAFLFADGIAPAGHWVKQETLGWLEKIKQDERRWHGSFVLGYLLDTNVAQDSILTTDANGTPTLAAPYSPSYDRDTGFYVGLELDFRILQSDRWTISSFGTASSTYYHTYTSYNAQSLSAGLSGAYHLSDKVTVGVTGKYLDSRYAYNYYQDYGTIEPNATVGLTDRLFLSAELPYTWYFPTRHYTTFGASFSGRYSFDGWKLFGGVGYTKANGAQATFYSYSQFSYVNTGEMFVNYTSWSKYAGATIDLPWSLYTTAQLTATSLNYNDEAVPSGTIQYGAAHRQDIQWIYGLELGRTMIQNLWNMDLSYNYTHNQSSGQQGLAYDSEQTNYNFNRSYWLLKSTLSF